MQDRDDGAPVRDQLFQRVSVEHIVERLDRPRQRGTQAAGSLDGAVAAIRLEALGGIVPTFGDSDHRAKVEEKSLAAEQVDHLDEVILGDGDARATCAIVARPSGAVATNINARRL
jgi:hypothetical protein